MDNGNHQGRRARRTLRQGSEHRKNFARCQRTMLPESRPIRNRATEREPRLGSLRAASPRVQFAARRASHRQTNRRAGDRRRLKNTTSVLEAGGSDEPFGWFVFVNLVNLSRRDRLERIGAASCRRRRAPAPSAEDHHDRRRLVGNRQLGPDVERQPPGGTRRHPPSLSSR